MKFNGKKHAVSRQKYGARLAFCGNETKKSAPFGVKFMKKKLISLASVFMTAAILTACSADVSTSFAANWYANPAATNVLPDTRETLVYDVSMPADTRANNSYYAEYTNGTYKTTLTDENGLYYYKTELTVDVQYFVGDEKSEKFTDTTVSEVRFKSTQYGLQPVSSAKTVNNHSPNSLSPKFAETSYKHYHYKTSITYNDECTQGLFTYDDLLSETDKVEVLEKKFSISSKQSYLDNEQLLFGVRGITSSAAQNISVGLTTSKKATVSTVNVSRASEENATLKFALNGEAASDKAVAYYPYSLKISSDNPGSTRIVWVASEAKYRGVIYRIEDPVSFSLGTLVYTLKEANFS